RLRKTLTLLPILISQVGSSQYIQSDASKKFDALLQYVNYAYVDSTDDNKLVENAIVAVLKELDPHSVYIPKEELKKMNEPLVGNFEGVGIQFNILHDTLVVVSPISGGPSEKVGLRAGDKIIEVDGENIAGIGLQNSDVQKKLRGKKGTKVNVGIKRRSIKEILNFTITRDKIPIYSVDASYMAAPEIGYIKISRFAKNTIYEFRESLARLKSQNMKHLIIDLRGNGGGYLKTAIQLADEVLDDKKLIVYTEGNKNPKQEYYTTTRGGFEKGKLVVLIDEGSASASEIVSGAIQDYDRGLIVGRRSFGKGLVQKPFSLPDGSAIRLTVARYHTPSGRCIQRPYDNGKEEYYKEFSRRFENGEYMNEDSIALPDSLQFKTLNSKRTVYGGGGIMPDVFVPIDTTMSSDYFGKVNRKGLLNEFALTYMDSHRKELQAKYNDIASFKESFNAEEEVLNDFIAYATKNDVEKNEEQINTSKKLIVIRLKALIARNLWDTSAYFQIANDLNDSYLKAIEEINSNTFRKEKLVYK
ncbi:MAG: PDZ domain-containing protein, partial [Flavobacteriales bacterium]|nr:PDZ domain-containing protein [Flavobacteriales bacterium]